MKLREIVLKVVQFVLALVVLAYIGDSVQYFVRSHSGTLISKVHRTRLLAIPNKGGKVEYQIDSMLPEEDLPCTNTLFPHSGMNPCWYVRKHANDPIQM